MKHMTDEECRTTIRLLKFTGNSFLMAAACAEMANAEGMASNMAQALASVQGLDKILLAIEERASAAMADVDDLHRNF